MRLLHAFAGVLQFSAEHLRKEFDYQLFVDCRVGVFEADAENRVVKEVVIKEIAEDFTQNVIVLQNTVGLFSVAATAPINAAWRRVCCNNVGFVTVVINIVKQISLVKVVVFGDRCGGRSHGLILRQLVRVDENAVSFLQEGLSCVFVVVVGRIGWCPAGT